VLRLKEHAKNSPIGANHMYSILQEADPLVITKPVIKHPNSASAASKSYKRGGGAEPKKDTAKKDDWTRHYESYLSTTRQRQVVIGVLRSQTTVVLECQQ